MRRSVLVAAVLLGWMAVSVAVGAPTYKLMPLGHLAGSPPWSGSSRACDINSFCQVIGNDAAGGAFVWDLTNGMRALPSLPSAYPSGAQASRISDTGMVAGWCQYPPIYSHTHQACVWTADGGVQGLGWLPQPDGGTLRSFAFGINGLNTVVGQSRWAFQWASDTGLQEVSHGLVEANDINDSGWIAGWLYSSEHYYGEAALLVDGVLTRLGPLGTRDSRACAINALGEIAGSVSWSSNENACVWHPDGSITNITPGGARYSTACDINDAGQVVGWCGDRDFAFVWSRTDGAVDLNALLDQPYAGWQIRSANAINNAGWIAGHGRNPWGQDEAVLLIPVPEPPSSLTVLFGLSGLIGLTRRCMMHLRSASPTSSYRIKPA